MPGFTGAKTASNTALDATKAATLVALTNSNAGYLIWGIQAFNSHATDASYVQFFDLAAGSVTVGSTTPTFVIGLAPKDGAYLAFTTPLQMAQVTTACTATATGSGAPAAAAILTLSYTAA